MTDSALCLVCKATNELGPKAASFLMNFGLFWGFLTIAWSLKNGLPYFRVKVTSFWKISLGVFPTFSI